MFLDPDRPDWEVDGADWPNRQYSTFVFAAGMRWHVQIAGEGPALLLLHGTGASAHSFRDLLEPLSHHFTVIAPDLPGHGFTEAPPSYRTGLPHMARNVADLLKEVGQEPTLCVGHSAGAAVLARMALDGLMTPEALMSFNGAFLPFKGPASQLAPVMAKALFVNPIAPRFFAYSAANRERVERLILGTGSELDPAGLEYYHRLFQRPGHIAGALAMMAFWDLEGLQKDLPRLSVPLLLVSGEKDKAIPPSEADAVKALVPGAEQLLIPGLGHLAHEEDPEAALEIIRHHVEQRRSKAQSAA